MKDSISPQDVRLWLYQKVRKLYEESFQWFDPDNAESRKKMEAVEARANVFSLAAALIGEKYPEVYLTVEELELSGETVRLLRSSGIHEVCDLHGKTDVELLHIPGFDFAKFREVEKALARTSIRVVPKTIGGQLGPLVGWPTA